MTKLHTYRPVIVVPAYKRPEALTLLLRSLNKANYPDHSIKLIISLEHNADEQVKQVANEFEFRYGSKEIRESKDALGIKNHIIQCADLSAEFGSVLILEDDLLVSPGFYSYSCKALSFYNSDKRIAGISLYGQRFNETAQLPFEPMPCSWDVYFMQLACSWGQAWTAGQWMAFKEWYAENKELKSSQHLKLPENVQNWPDDSWKKYFNLYLLENNNYIAYPYRSFTTNNSSFGGKNMKGTGNLFQVPVGITTQDEEPFNFPDFDQQIIRYDSYMEESGLITSELIGLPVDELAIDLYGAKPSGLLKKKKFIVSSKKGPKPSKSFPLELKPLEMNLIVNQKGNNSSFFHLYETEQVTDMNPINSIQYAQMADYFSYFRPVTKKYFIGYLSQLIKRLFN